MGSFFFFLKMCIYLFLERGEGRRKRGTGTSMCQRYNDQLPLICAPYWGPGLKPRPVPWLGIEPVTFWFLSWHSVPWATPARATWWVLNLGSVGVSNVYMHTWQRGMSVASEDYKRGLCPPGSQKVKATSLKNSTNPWTLMWHHQTL